MISKHTPKYFFTHGDDGEEVCSGQPYIEALQATGG